MIGDETLFIFVYQHLSQPTTISSDDTGEGCCMTSETSMIDSRNFMKSLEVGSTDQFHELFISSIITGQQNYCSRYFICFLTRHISYIP